jgi:hypothetical protein
MPCCGKPRRGERPCPFRCLLTLVGATSSGLRNRIMITRRTIPRWSRLPHCSPRRQRRLTTRHLCYMRQVAKDMLAAHRQGTVPAFLRVVQRHADIPDISIENALGKYSSSLQSSQRGRYQKGVATYLARYFALSSRDFTVAKYEIGEATVDNEQGRSGGEQDFSDDRPDLQCVMETGLARRPLQGARCERARILADEFPAQGFH